MADAPYRAESAFAKRREELRDHFAGLALAGMLAREYLGPAEATHDAYTYADAMLIARARENGA